MLQLNDISAEICAKETRAFAFISAPEIVKKKESVGLVGWMVVFENFDTLVLAVTVVAVTVVIAV